MDFPSSPILNQQYSFAGRTWMWNGSGWARVGGGAGPGNVSQTFRLYINFTMYDGSLDLVTFDIT